MIDLHCHSTFSDGEFNPKDLLKKAEALGLNYFSITDHNNCFAYENLNTNEFKGKLIRGVEIVTSFDKHIIEILGYGMNIKEINDWNSIEKKKEPIYAKMIYDRLMAILKKYKIYYNEIEDPSIIIRENWTTGKVKQFFYNEILKYEKNKLKIGEEVLSSYSNFNKKGLNNPNSIIFINEYSRFPSINEVIDLIHRNGGLCFLAHLYQYNVNNHIEFLDKIRDSANLDGVEVYHSSFSRDQIEEITKYADENNLYKSGGSDYHGKLKPGISLGADLQISEEILNPWIYKVI